MPGTLKALLPRRGRAVSASAASCRAPRRPRSSPQCRTRGIPGAQPASYSSTRLTPPPRRWIRVAVMWITLVTY